MLKVGYFTTSFPYKNPLKEESVDTEDCIRGGVGEVVYNLSLGLAQLGHKIYVFTTSADSKDHVEKYGRITIYRYGRGFRIADTNISLGLLSGALRPKLDVVHLHLGSPPATLASLRLIRRRRKPFVVTHHLDPEWDYGSVVRRALVYVYAKYYVKKALSESDVIIALSEHFLNASNFLTNYRTKMEIIPNGINLKDFDPPYTKIEAREELGLSSDDKIILFVGSLTERKGPQVLLRAMHIVLRNAPDSRLVLVGSSTKYLESLKKLAKHLNIEDKVEFTGFVDDAVKLMYYKSADVFALPSFSESFALVLLEASACSLPLVVSGLDVFKAIVEEGYNGLFTKTGDGKDLADAIIYLLENEQVRARFGKNARERVEKYSWKEVVEKTESIYNRLLADNN